jgi:REP element-mobilizing transposase RayT
MPRQARIKSSTDIYHIMIRGINKEQIFKKETYKMKVLNILYDIKEEVEFTIISYCIMDNHLHLLVKAREENLEIFMKKLNIKFAIYYNKIEKRYGHVFQDRYKSEAVEDDGYLLGALRYIHNNPVKARITKNILDYPWSGAKDYIVMESNLIPNEYLNKIMSLFSNVDEFKKFHVLTDDNVYIDTKEEETENINNITNSTIEKFINGKGILDQNQITLEQKEELAGILLKKNIIPHREIAALCNLSLYKVTSINNKKK